MKLLQQDFLFTLPVAILGRFCPQPSPADEIIAVRNNDHSISMFLETSGSCWNFFAMLVANYFLTSLSAGPHIFPVSYTGRTRFFV